MRSKRLRYLAVASLLILTFYVIGIGDYLAARSFEEFNYPLNVDIPFFIQEMRSGKPPPLKPINYYPYRYLSNSGKCKAVDKVDLLILVKSAMNNFVQRDAIRNSWGQENELPGKIIKVLFFLGIDVDYYNNSEVQRKINKEMSKYNDIIQMDFIDQYFNNTIKTMMSFRWAYQHCPAADYYLFSDDDMYINVRNLLDFAETRVCGEEGTKSISSFNLSERDDNFFAGYVFNSVPQRIMSSKWRISLDEYPWNKWPTYVTAGAYVVSNRCLKTLYLASLFVKHFRFDDIYLGIVAKKAGIRPVHCPEFHFEPVVYSRSEFKYLIASHGYGNYDDLIRVWEEERHRGK